MSLRLVPITQRAAQRFIAQHHRHHRPSVSSILQVAVTQDDELVGVAMAGRPVARGLCDGVTLEVTRTCVKPDARHVNSMLYAACARAATALGYRRILTYTLPDESGASLRAAGWLEEPGQYGHRDASAWQSHATKSGELFPDSLRRVDGLKRRWMRVLQP